MINHQIDDTDGLANLFARMAGEAERIGNRPISLCLTLSQVALIGALISLVTNDDSTKPAMIGASLELAHGMAAELFELDLAGTAGVILAGLPEEEAA